MHRLRRKGTAGRLEQYNLRHLRNLRMTNAEPEMESVRRTFVSGGWTISNAKNGSLPQHQDHSRDWRDNLYVYPVISRRSGGLSIGINLSPDAQCNYACVYCQVDRSTVPIVRDVDLDRVREELHQTINLAQSGDLFAAPSFEAVPDDQRQIKDIAFSGNGEPTAAAQFPEAVEIAALARRSSGLDETKIVLITNACYLTRPEVERALAVMDENNGEVWAKLDAGTEAFHQQINRPNFPLRHVMDNITAASRTRPVVIQSLFVRLDGCPPDDAELGAYVERLEEIVQAGGSIKYVQIYTVARRPSEECVAPLTKDEVDQIVERVRQSTGLSAKAFYGPG